MTQATAVPPFVNRAMKSVLRSPLHRIVSKSILLISFTGRKSGKKYTTPVSYSQEGDRITIFTHANWWKNLNEELPLTLRLQGCDVRGFPETISDDQNMVAAALSDHLKNVPSDARYYQVTFDDHGNPVEQDVLEAVKTVVMIKIRII